ncbi:hypothetical protein I545_6894 [Mycobacterium kansasii 662]|uniref:Uncharacterized protein n=1 Tax=Mycobacterium kansasii 662 TaxID=1299326 RepID=X7XR72_MYCKA|nr:hypothetical protein I545_6894 [Mycobacterium kansasii 662]
MLAADRLDLKEGGDLGRSRRCCSSAPAGGEQRASLMGCSANFG